MSEGVYIYRNGGLLVFLNKRRTLLCLAKKNKTKKEERKEAGALRLRSPRQRGMKEFHS